MRVVMATVFEPGDFVRLKSGATARVGVVCHVNPDSVTSVQVCWHRSELTRITDVYAPDALRLVPPDEVPEYAVALKMNLELGKPR